MEPEDRSSRAIVRAVAAIWLALVVGLGALAVVIPHEQPTIVPYSRFIAEVQRGTVRAVTLDGNSVRWTTLADEDVLSPLPAPHGSCLRLLRAKEVAITDVPQPDPAESYLLPIALTAAVALLVIL
jgi:hypothetical protein